MNQSDIQHLRDLIAENGAPANQITVLVIPSGTATCLACGHSERIIKTGIEAWGKYVCSECGLYFSEDGTMGVRAEPDFLEAVRKAITR